MKKIDCVNDITMESITLDELGKAFAEAEERARQTSSVEGAIFILREIYLCLRTRALEDYITKNLVDKDATSEEKTVLSERKESLIDSSENQGCRRIHPNYREYSKDARVCPGEILYLNLDGEWRPYRVLTNDYGIVRLLALFSIKEVSEEEEKKTYFRSLSNDACAAWNSKIQQYDFVKNNQVLSDFGDSQCYVHIPVWDELRQDCEAISGDLTSAWYSDDDVANIQVYTGDDILSVLGGEEGELCMPAYAEAPNLYYPYEIRPMLTLRFGSIPYYYNRADRAEVQEFS